MARLCEWNKESADLRLPLFLQLQQHVLDVRLDDLRPVRLVLGILNALRSIHIDAIPVATSRASHQQREAGAATWQKARQSYFNVTWVEHLAQLSSTVILQAAC